jgi:hypothetical protein
MAVALAVFVLVVGLGYSSTAAVGSDSYGYVSQADLWLKGDLHVDQPWIDRVPWPAKAWTFTPLGYRPSEISPRQLVPTYSPGLPLLMAAAVTIGGHRTAFWIVPVSGALLVLLTYATGRRLGMPRAGLIGAWFVATSPVLLIMLTLPMTDVPVAAAWAAAFYFLLGPSRASAAAAGLAAATAIVIRPNLAPLAAVLAIRYLLPASRDVIKLAAFSLCAAAGAVVTAAINARLYGSPFISGYGSLDSMFAWRHLLPNMRAYGGWLLGAQTPIVLAGLLAVLVPLRRFWPGVRDRSALYVAAIFVAALWIEYCAYLEFDFWVYLRFLLPAWPLLMIGLGAMALYPARRNGAGAVLATAWIVICLGVYEYRIAGSRGAFYQWRSERASVLAAQRVRDITAANSVVFTMFHSGSVRYYGGRMTLRYDQLDPEWLDRSVAWLAQHGAHPYLLLNDWELPQFVERFRSQQTVSVVELPPLFEYHDSMTIYCFDLLPGSIRPKPVTISDVDVDLRSVLPAPAPTLILQ